MPQQVKDVSGCQDCPLRGEGTQNFVPDTILPGSKVFVCGQNPGVEEEKKGEPFVGQTGKTLDGEYLPILGVPRSAASVGNAIRCRWQNSNELPPITGVLARAAVDHCTRAHLRLPESIRLVVAQGAYALYALTGHGYAVNDKISSWRGWMLPVREDLGGQKHEMVDVFTPSSASLLGGVPVLATLHLAAVSRNPALKVPTKMDWDRGRRFLMGKWPLPVPAIHREIDELMFVPESSWDTEFIPDAHILLRFSVATGERVYVIENYPGLRESLHRALIRRAQADPRGNLKGLTLELVQSRWKEVKAGADLRLFFQNAVADLPYLADIFPEKTIIRIEDEMLAHSVLFGGEQHSLDYLSSLVSSYNRHKHLDQSNPVLYSGMDAVTQYEVWRWMEQRLKRDPQSEKEYRESVLPLVPIILEAETVGIPINPVEVAKGMEYLNFEMQDSTDIAQAAVGYKINLGSNDQVARQLYDIEGLKAPRARR